MNREAAIRVWPLGLLMAACVSAGAADAVLVIGVGAVRHAIRGPVSAADADRPRWESRVHAGARRDAEEVFRRLVPATRLAPGLYAHSPRWYDTGSAEWDAAVLLTDGVTDNAALPVASQLLWESRRLGQEVGPRDRFMIFAAAPGHVEGWDTWIFGRLGQRLDLRALVEDLPPGPGERTLIARIYPPAGDGPPHTLAALDSGRADALRNWAGATRARTDPLQPATAPPTLLPGLGDRLVSISPSRTARLCTQLAEHAPPMHGLALFDLGQALEPSTQRLEFDLQVREIPIFRTLRRPGPLFTIVEVETDEQIGTRHEFDRASLTRRLTEAGVARDSADAIAGRIAAGVAADFRDALPRPEATYQIAYERAREAVTVVYDD